MNEQEFFTIVKTELKPKIKNIHRHSLLTKDLKADSLSFLRLVLALEKHWRLRLDDEKLASVVTLGDLAALIEEKEICCPPTQTEDSIKKDKGETEL